MRRVPEQGDSRPWYKEPWPWVIISIPLAAVIMGLITLYLALTRPDYLVVEQEQYHDIRSQLRAQPSASAPSDPETAPEGGNDGEP